MTTQATRRRPAGRGASRRGPRGRRRAEATATTAPMTTDAFARLLASQPRDALGREGRPEVRRVPGQEGRDHDEDARQHPDVGRPAPRRAEDGLAAGAHDWAIADGDHDGDPDAEGDDPADHPGDGEAPPARVAAALGDSSWKASEASVMATTAQSRVTAVKPVTRATIPRTSAATGLRPRGSSPARRGAVRRSLHRRRRLRAAALLLASPAVARRPNFFILGRAEVRDHRAQRVPARAPEGVRLAAQGAPLLLRGLRLLLRARAAERGALPAPLRRGRPTTHLAVGEASVWYLYSADAARNIAAFDPARGSS